MGGAGAAAIGPVRLRNESGRPALRGPSASGPGARGAVPVGAGAEAVVGAGPPGTFLPVPAAAASGARSAQPRARLVPYPLFFKPGAACSPSPPRHPLRHEIRPVVTLPRL